MAANAALPKRIIKETQRLIADSPPGISAVPHDDNLRYFDVLVSGPEGSPFEGQSVSRIHGACGAMGGAEIAQCLLSQAACSSSSCSCPKSTPWPLPKSASSPNSTTPTLANKLGRICLDILKDKWSPALQIRTVLLSVQALLSAPNPDDPLANDVAAHWKENEKDAMRVSREWTQKYASASA